jgi:hypothetical protein
MLGILPQVDTGNTGKSMAKTWLDWLDPQNPWKNRGWTYR